MRSLARLTLEDLATKLLAVQAISGEGINPAPIMYKMSHD
jgi:hypothetical protein